MATALEFEEEEEEAEHDRLLDGRTATTSNSNSSGNRRSGSSKLLLSLPLFLRTFPTTPSHHHQSCSSGHHQLRRRRQQPQRLAILLILFISAALLFIAARNRYRNYINSNSIITSSSSSIQITNNSIDNHDDNNSYNHPPLFNQTFATFLTSGLTKILAANNGITKHYIYDSPYEQRFPHSKQPYWARKTIPLNKRIKLEQQICLVHVGKAGGSTLGCMLGFSLHCDDNNKISANGDTNGTVVDNDDGDDDDNENDGKEKKRTREKMAKLQIKGLLPIATTHVFHRGVNDCADVAACELRFIYLY
jgi:hypothetical protein